MHAAVIKCFLWLFAVTDAAAIQAHYRDLGSDDFATRQRAQAALEAYGLLALPQLERGRVSPDTEVRVRCDRARRAIITRVVGSRDRCFVWSRKRWPEMPMIDSLWYDTSLRCHVPDQERLACRIGRAYLAKTCLGYQEGTDFPTFRGATRLLVVDLLVIGVPDWVIDPMLREMNRRDEMWFEGRPWRRR